MTEAGTRRYTLGKRKSAQEETRERIVAATMALHDIKGVVATSYVDIAEKAGVGAATVYRHFPRLGDLVNACGAHAAEEMQPFMRGSLPALPVDVNSLEERLMWLCGELDAFYRRGGVRLEVAQCERARVPELEQFMVMVEAGIDALVAHALGPLATEEGLRAAIALTRLQVWESLRVGGLLEQGMGFWAGTLQHAMELAEEMRES
jgi:AcrR family transcriptional regulator